MKPAPDLILTDELKDLARSYLAYCLFLKRLEADPRSEPTMVYAVRIAVSGLRDEFRTILQAEGVVRWTELLKHATDSLLQEAGGDESPFLALVPIRL